MRESLQQGQGVNLVMCKRYRHESKNRELLESDLDLFKFAFVRNPWDRVVSAWAYACDREWYNGRRVIKKIPNPSFDEFVRNHMWDEDGNAISVHWLPQCEFVEYDGEIFVDFLGRFETLAKDYAEVCNKIGIPIDEELPVVNTSKHEHYTTYYTEELKQIIAEKYARDIELFGYEFGK